MSMDTIRNALLVAERFIKIVNWSLLIGAGLTILAMMFWLSYDVVMSYFFDEPTDWATELAKYCLLYLIFLPLGYAQMTGQHIRVDAITSRLSQRMQTRVDIVATAISLLAFIIFTWSAYNYAFDIKGQSSGPIHYWPLFTFIVVMPIGLFMLSIQIFITLVKDVVALFQKPQAES